jgi:hypothetical protein
MGELKRADFMGAAGSVLVVYIPPEGTGCHPRQKPTTQENAAEWVKTHLGFEPDEKQRLVLTTGSKRGIVNCTRQWGKSFIAAAKAVHQAWSVAGSLTLVVSPSARQSKLLVRTAKMHGAKLGIQPKGDGDNPISMLFPNGSRIVGLPGKETTIRGFSAVSLLLIDEASRANEEAYDAVLPMLATTDGALWLMSTPNGQRGFFYDEWANGGDEWERISVPATECARISPEFLEKQRARRSDRIFRQEYLCEFAAVKGGVFNMEQVENAFTDEFAPLRLR